MRAMFTMYAGIAQASQCFTTAKAWSLVLVIVGTTTYALSGRGEATPDADAYRAYCHDEDRSTPEGWVRHSDGGFVRIRGDSAPSYPEA